MAAPARAASETPILSERILRTLKVPGDSDEGELELVEGALRCRRTGRVFPFEHGVPSLFQPTEGEGSGVTTKVKSFYEENPFPSYEGVEEFGSLVARGRENSFTTRLLRSVGYNKMILECGTGTGQLAQYLQLNNNHVLGVDMSLASLSLAIEHKLRNNLARSNFAQMNIFNLAVKDDSFDIVISHGVLHHTYDAKKAFSHIVRKAKPGGIVMVGLYNSYARILTWIRSKLIRVFGPRIDYVVRNRILDRRKAEIWVADQYYNPHETWHSIGEVLGWFEENDIEFLNCSPAILGTDGEDTTDFFAETDPGNSWKRAVTQVGWLGSIAREGSLFDVIGRRRA